MALTYWEVNLAGDQYNTNTSGKIGINNPHPVLELDVIGSIGVSSLIEFKKASSDVIQLKSASALGYDFMVYNATKNAYRFFISAAGKVAVGTNAAVNKFTVVETTPGNAWAAASFTNTSTVGFGIEVTGGNEDNSTAVFKNYANVIGANLSGRGELFVRDWIASNAGTSVNGRHHFRMENNHLRFSFLLEDDETGVNNEGSNFSLRRYSDAGNEIGKVLKVIRNTGEIIFSTNTTFGASLFVQGTLGATATSIPLGALVDVAPSATPTADGNILRVVNGKWDSVGVDTLPHPDMSAYLTKPLADTYYVPIGDFTTHINDQSNPHMVSLQEVMVVNNATTQPLFVENFISALSLKLGDTTLSAVDNILTIDGDVVISGEVLFGGIVDLFLHQLTDVADSVEIAPNGSLLKKIGGAWTAVPDPSDTPIDLSSYYTKSEADNKYVDVAGDTMIGGLTINTLTDNLKLVGPTGGSVLSVFNSSVNAETLKLLLGTTGNSLILRDTDFFDIEKPMGTVLKVNANGSVTFGDSTKSSSTLGNISVTSASPYLSLINSVSGTHGSGFRIINSGATTAIQIGGGPSLSGLASMVVFNGGTSTSNVELKYNNTTKLETTATGIKVYDNINAKSLTMDSIQVYKSADGKFVIDGDLVITGNYKKEWSGPGTGLPLGVEYFVDLKDVGISSIAGVGAPFLVGGTGGSTLTAITKTSLASTFDLVSLDMLQEHKDDTVVHITSEERLNWDLAVESMSTLYDWDLIYTSHDKKEVGLSDVGEAGEGISNSKDTMKYIFYWDSPGGNRHSLKTRFSDDSDHLHKKPWDEFRHTRALGYSLLSADALFERGLYDVGTVHQYERNVPRDGSWQIETIDSSYIYNQNAPIEQKHKYQLATRWVDRETSFDLWARGRDGATQEWLPWVQFNHSGNTPQAIELYPELPAEAYDELENEANWTFRFSTPGDTFELYTGETEGIDWAFQIGHRVVNKQYIYEVTPIGIRRNGNTNYMVVEVSTNLLTTSFTVEPYVDRYEITMAIAANDIQVIVDHRREKPVVINLNNTTLYGVDIMYTQEVGPNIKLLDMEPDAIIEVHPGVWQLN